ncbi:Sec-independent protein translocase protein TatC [Aquisphaera giovannonii]|uniref:Sec-independent protein translocase protein TatC n=1 Tax=Aquisphaera giovannonii TaxID=406548 RepID=A0A5B9VYA6_9BACT|nr:twin-arginine translocase subunit TatC [Aquisphaera giovannonii]QEH33292.1 Sec-independent protein translocase protein TatC [Aquisphaera giovannonii]
MPSDRDLFTEEQQMATMSFGEHIEELRVRLILALIGLAVGIIIAFIPYMDLGWRVMKSMEAPAKGALERFYADEYRKKAEAAEASKELSPPVEAVIPADSFVGALKQVAPHMDLPAPETLEGKTVTFPLRYLQHQAIRLIENGVVQIDQSLISLGPLETITIYFMVCLVTGLVLVSPWVFYQAWAFVAAGLYRHERHYVKKYLPISLGLFLGGVFLCFFFVLPLTLRFLLEFNVWLGVAPTLRLSEWMSFATVLPLVFGIAFQTPLIMLFLERIGIFTVDDFRAKRKLSILVITIAAAILTPGQDPISMLLLAVPMVLLYELGIILIGYGKVGGKVPANVP